MPTQNRPHKVVITDFLTHPPETEESVLGDLARVEVLRADHEEQLAGHIEDAAAVMIYHTLKFTARSIERLTRCKLIVRCGVGFDNVDWRFARERGIPVANVPDYGTEEVADSAIGLLLSMTRGISLLNSQLRQGGIDWSYRHAVPLGRLRGRVLGIVGLGRIGSAAALRGKALGMDVIYYDPYAPDGRDKSLGVRRVESLEELLSQSYAVSLHCPLNDETRHLIRAETLEQMRAGSYLVNTSRGAVVDTTAIPAAILSGKLAGAALDVLPFEPPAESDPLVAAWRNPEHPAYHRVILNPHMAFYSEEGLLDMRVKGAEACRRALVGLPLRNVVN